MNQHLGPVRARLKKLIVLVSVVTMSIEAVRPAISFAGSNSQSVTTPYHIALTPREAKKYSITRLRDYNNAVNNIESEEEDRLFEEVVSDSLRVVTLASTLAFLMRKGKSLFSVAEKLARIAKIPGTGYIVKAIGAGAFAVSIPALVYYIFTNDIDHRVVASVVFAQVGGMFMPIEWAQGVTASGWFGLIPFEVWLLGSQIQVNQKTETRSLITRKLKEYFNMDYPSDLKYFYRAVNRVKLHADRSCQAFGGNKASSSAQGAVIKPIKFTEENFARGEVWLDGKPITAEEALQHQYLSSPQDFYVFKDGFDCHRGEFRNKEVDISDLVNGEFAVN